MPKNCNEQISRQWTVDYKQEKNSFDETTRDLVAQRIHGLQRKYASRCSISLDSTNYAYNRPVLHKNDEISIIKPSNADNDLSSESSHNISRRLLFDASSSFMVKMRQICRQLHKHVIESAVFTDNDQHVLPRNAALNILFEGVASTTKEHFREHINSYNNDDSRLKYCFPKSHDSCRYETSFNYPSTKVIPESPDVQTIASRNRTNKLNINSMRSKSCQEEPYYYYLRETTARSKRFSDITKPQNLIETSSTQILNTSQDLIEKLNETDKSNVTMHRKGKQSSISDRSEDHTNRKMTIGQGKMRKNSQPTDLPYLYGFGDNSRSVIGGADAPLELRIDEEDAQALGEAIERHLEFLRMMCPENCTKAAPINGDDVNGTIEHLDMSQLNLDDRFSWRRQNPIAPSMRRPGEESKLRKEGSLFNGFSSVQLANRRKSLCSFLRDLFHRRYANDQLDSEQTHE